MGTILDSAAPFSGPTTSLQRLSPCTRIYWGLVALRPIQIVGFERDAEDDDVFVVMADSSATEPEHADRV